LRLWRRGSRRCSSSTPHLRAGPPLPSEEPLIREAVANTRFDKLRAKEDAEGGSHERPQGCEQLQQLEEAFAAPLHRFGYGVAVPQ